MYKWKELSFIGKWNVYLFQLLFFRIQHEGKPKGNLWILFPIIPFTGWWNDYWPKKYFTIQIRKEKSQKNKREQPPKPWPRN